MNKKTSIVKKENNRNLVWAGASSLMVKPQSAKEIQDRKLVLLVANVLEVSPFGVNVLGGMPYVNNIGLKEKVEDYHPGASFEYNWVKRSENDTDKAICEARLAKGGKPLTPWVVGEASPATIKMRTLTGYQNHLAQTRSENRCVRYLDGLRIHKDMLANIAKLQKRGEIDEENTIKVANATTVPAEELTQEIKTPIIYGVPMNKTEKSDPVELAKNFILSAKSKESLNTAEVRIKANKDFSEENRKYLLMLIKNRLTKLK